MALNESLAAQGLDLASFGAAYLILLGHLLATIALFLLSRSALVITPNRATKHYGLYVVVVLVSLLLATALENALLPVDSPALQYAAVPQLVMVLIVHLWIYYRQEPWLVALGAASIFGAGIVVSVTAVLSTQVHMAHWLAVMLLYGLLGHLWFHSISTKRAFLKAASIYIETKERRSESLKPQMPWLGLPQWVALVLASVMLAALNSMLRGSGLEDIRALQVLVESVFLLGVTTLVCAVPAATYWLAHKHWMPELTRFAWLVWLVVGFAFTYGNYLGGLDRV